MSFRVFAISPSVIVSCCAIQINSLSSQYLAHFHIHVKVSTSARRPNTIKSCIKAALDYKPVLNKSLPFWWVVLYISRP